MHVCKKNTELRAGRPPKSPYTLIHGYTHTHTDTYIDTCPWTYTQMHIWTHINAHTDKYTHVHMWMHTNALMNT